MRGVNRIVVTAEFVCDALAYYLNAHAVNVKYDIVDFSPCEDSAGDLTGEFTAYNSMEEEG